MRDRERATEWRRKSAEHLAPPEVEEWMPRVNRVRVLVIDDEPSICKALEIALTRSGFAVMTVGSGEASSSAKYVTCSKLGTSGRSRPAVRSSPAAHGPAVTTATRAR